MLQPTGVTNIATVLRYHARKHRPLATYTITWDFTSALASRPTGTLQEHLPGTVEPVIQQLLNPEEEAS